MSESVIRFRPIGVIHSEHVQAEATPIQPGFAADCQGRVEVSPEWAAGLHDLDGLSHIYLIYHLHQADAPKLAVKPFLQDVERGIFATRAPCRPNAIGMSIVRLLRREGSTLHIEGVDILDGTPLLDIKPYTTRFDHIQTLSNGWQDEVDEATAQRLGRRAYAGGKL